MKKNAVFIILGIFILTISFLYPFIVNYLINKGTLFDFSNINWTKSGTFGDTFGALNAVFSGLTFLGLIYTIHLQRSELGYQREELSLQRNEMQETRKEFLINRTTTIIYSQLEKYEKVIAEFIVFDEGKKIQGNDAFLLMESIVKRHLIIKNDNQRVDENIASLEFFIKNHKPLNYLAYNIFNIIAVLKDVLLQSNLSADEITNLKTIFCRNVGFMHTFIFDFICLRIDERNELYKTHKSSNPESLSSGQLTEFSKYIKVFSLFMSISITEKNLPSIKKQWKEDLEPLAYIVLSGESIDN